MEAIPNRGSVTVPVTIFKDYAASEKREIEITLPDLAKRIAETTARQKSGLPWLKLGRFGDQRTEKNSLRHDANMLAVSGIEVDYDEEKISADDAVEKLTKAGILSIFYTSPSHTEDTPRWRVLAPTSIELPPEKRKHLVGRINGIFGGALANESWTLSQSYYFGSVNRNPSHRVEVIDGTPIDQLDELDEIWCGPPDTKQATNGTRIGPLDEPALLQAIADGRSYHEASVRLLGRWARNGVPYMDARQRLVDAMEAVFPPDRDERWRDRRADVDRCLEDIYGKDARAKDEGKQPPRAAETIGAGCANSSKPEPNASTSWAFINPIELQGRAIPERQFIVQNWIAPGHVTIDFGDGGVGKTLLAQMLMTSCCTGHSWCGLAVNPCRAVGLFCEDDGDEIQRRQDAINRAYGIDFEDLAGMTYTTGVGQDNTLVSFEADGHLQLTSAFLTLERVVREFGAGLLVVDTAADTFGGNENNRREVRQFVGAALGRIAKEHNCAVLLNAHPSRSGMSATGDLDGGSTGWSNTARARWSLTRPKADGEEQADTNERILTRRKSNYASIGDTIKLRWQNGVLVPANAPTGLAAVSQQANAEAVFLELLAKSGAEGRPLSDSRNAGNSAPKMFAQRPDRHGFNRRDFEGAMQRLFAAGSIRMEEYGRVGSSGRPRRIVRVEAGADG